jgi:hypothetical protein
MSFFLKTQDTQDLPLVSPIEMKKNNYSTHDNAVEERNPWLLLEKI